LKKAHHLLKHLNSASSSKVNYTSHELLFNQSTVKTNTILKGG
jgi:hypothetical protein